MSRTPEAMAAAIALAALMTGCTPETARSAGTEGPSVYMSEGSDGTAAVDSWITQKNHYPPGSVGDADRWEFCFDSADGGWTCLPVSEADYNRFEPGDRVQARQRVGQLASVEEIR
ncbi:hypothetical protein [Paractinoplanes toevensis]|uniref:Lipoprotein n=1 Tax=Paractinoplanes toevensis TaxID=571911 RepID=A0A919T6T4_9ACTN|nr:hypothetical protein [Actinoplanes toevensis]GIM88799.1 hypothetical protein Ato02nite_005920 [Actinoplanes toevensis]